MRYKLRENVDIDFGVIKQYEIAERIGIHNVTLCNILKRKKCTSKAVALYIVILNGGTEKDIDKYFVKEK